MVTIVDFKTRENKEGEPFNALIVEGGVELVKSENGSFYCTTKQASVPSTFNEETCQNLIGQQLPGEVVKVQCEPYEYLNEKTGELIMKDYRWTLQQENPSMEIPEIIQ